MAHGTLPAVSEINAKASAILGSVDGDYATGVLGSLSFPLTHSFGIQIDGAAGSAAGAGFWGVAGHAFWRDPSRGLIGFYGSYAAWDSATTSSSTTLPGGVVDTTGAEIGKIGAEAEAYLGRVSLEGLAAYQYGTRTGFTGRATLGYYPTDNLRLEAGVNYISGPGAAGIIGAEWQPHADNGLTLFANGSIASGNHWSAIGGLRVYFAGEQKALIRRHREDDPSGLEDLPADFFTVTSDSHCPDGQSIINDDGFIYCDGLR